PGQLLRQLMVESVVLVSLGAVAGIALSLGVLKLLKTTTALDLPRLAHATMRPAVLEFVLTVSAVVVFFLTLLPAWRTLQPPLLEDLQGVGRSSAGRGVQLAGRVLVVAQLTLSVVLLACAGWMIGGVYLLLHQPLGFAADHLLMLEARFGSHNLTKAEALQWEVWLGAKIGRRLKPWGGRRI